MRSRHVRSGFAATARIFVGAVLLACTGCADDAAPIDPATAASASSSDTADSLTPSSEPTEPAVPAPAPSAGVSDTSPKTVPQQCSILVSGVQPDTNLVAFRYEKGRLSSEVAGRIGWVPRTMTTVTDLESSGTAFWAIREDGMLYRISVYEDDGGARVIATRVAAGWGGIRVLAAGSPTGDSGVTYLYGLTVTGGLKRFVTSPDGQQLLSAKTIATTGWADVRTLSFDRVRFTGPSAHPRESDVMIATTNSGYLAEFAFPRTAYQLWLRTNLRTSNWNDFATLTSGFCDADRPSRPIMAVRSDGTAYLYVDQNGNDGWGGDIGAGTKVATWSGAKLYNQ